MFVSKFSLLLEKKIVVESFIEKLLILVKAIYKLNKKNLESFRVERYSPA